MPASAQSFLPKIAAITAVAMMLAVPSARANLVGLYLFNNAANIGQDSSGYGSNLVAVGNVGYTASGQQGGGLALSGGILTTANGQAPNGFPLGGSSYTLSTSFRTTDTNGIGMIGWGNYGSSGQTNSLRTLAGGGLDNYWWDYDLYAAANTDNGAWHTATVTFNAATQVRDLYLDGVLIAAESESGIPNVQPGNFAVGETCIMQGCGDEHFYGTLDNVAVFNQALTSAQVQQVVAGNFGSFGIPEPATLGLLGVGAVVVGLARNRWRR